MVCIELDSNLRTRYKIITTLLSTDLLTVTITEYPNNKTEIFLYCWYRQKVLREKSLSDIKTKVCKIFS